MRNTTVIDANTILRYLLADHPEHHEKAKELMDLIRTGDVRGYIPEGVLVECVYVLLKVYRVPRREVADRLCGVLRFKGIVPGHSEILLESLQLFKDRNVDIVDAIVHVTAETRGWEWASFDRDLHRLRRQGKPR